jgi:mannosyl-3-phosphoglycerate phosphatase
VTPDRLVVSGIDGGILDPLTGGYDPVRPAIDALARRRVPLVLCSGRPRAEVTFVSRTLGLDAPMIAENGAVLLVPAGHLPGGVPGAGREGEWQVLRLGPPRETMRLSLEAVAAAAGARVRLLSDLTSGQRPSAREHTEPFLLQGEDDAVALARVAEVRGLRLARGPGFWYLCGGADKGLAVRTLLALYEREGNAPEAIGLGCWEVDLPMLRAVRRPIVVPGPGGRIEPALAASLPGVERAWHGGPSGWNDAVLSALAGRRLPVLASPTPRPASEPLASDRAAS